ncbi:MAG: hypothetical protein WCO04_12520 [Pseudomonadota bacterium]
MLTVFCIQLHAGVATKGIGMFPSDKLASLRKLLFEMEQDLGLADLSGIQRDVYYAARLTAEGAEMVRGEAIRSHALLNRISRPTFYRALKDLELAGYLSHADTTRSGKYRLLR